ncbi:MAG TPA: aldo/keto reductase [Armatimonadota bacterium]|jgi:aryl-alcohol dehydrogenase-like predicted oxidoreductase
MQRVTLGKTGIETSRLCVGTGTNGWEHASNQTRLGQEAFTRIFERALDQGITFWDGADQYGSHSFLANAKRGLDRGRLQITTKTVARTAEEARADIPRFLKELETDYLDVVMLHCMTHRGWVEEREPVMEVLTHAKEQGYIRALGVTCHNLGAFERAAETEWVEVNLCRINHAGRHMDAAPEVVVPLLQRMHDRGAGTYGMKVMGCGDLRDDPAKAFRYVFDLDCLDAISLGVENEAEIDQAVHMMREHDRRGSALQPA